jgi:hypothetical protein
MDPSNSRSFVFIRGSFLIVCDYGYAALWSSVQVPIVTSPLRGRDRDENQYTEGHEDHRGGESATRRRADSQKECIRWLEALKEISESRTAKGLALASQF